MGLRASALALALAAAIPAGALESRIELYPGAPALLVEDSSLLPAGSSRRSPVFGDWKTDGVILAKGWRGGFDWVLERRGYDPGVLTDLLLHFDDSAPVDASGAWTVRAGPAWTIDPGRPLLGAASASFRGPSSALSLVPGPSALLGRDSAFRDFSIEFWLYPALAENGELILLWQSIRRLPGGVLPQQLSCVIAGGRVAWSFSGLFAPPGANDPATAARVLELRARSPLVPLTWSHHLLRFDGDTGLLEYLVDGLPEAVSYATSTGREGGTVWQPAAGAASPLQLAADYAGLVDEFRIERRFVEDPVTRPYGRDGALVLSPIVDLGFGASALLRVEAAIRGAGNASVELSYRIDDGRVGWGADSPAWTPFRPGEKLPGNPRGRYVQIRAELFPDGTGRLSPALSTLVLRYVPDPPPPPPARLVATPKDGAVELAWTPVPEADVAGYLVWYGEGPGDYFGAGAVQGPSPVDAGNTRSLLLAGLPNGRLVYLAVAAYDSPGLEAGSSPASRAGELSAEASARPSRTAR